MIDLVKTTFFTQKRHIEVPESKSLAPDSKKIKASVCKEYNINEKGLLISKRGMTNEPRNIAIYLMRQLMGSKLEEIGQEFGINNYSSVSTVIERTKQKAIHDRKLRKRIEKVKSYLMVRQEQI